VKKSKYFLAPVLNLILKVFSDRKKPDFHPIFQQNNLSNSKFSLFPNLIS